MAPVSWVSIRRQAQTSKYVYLKIPLSFSVQTVDTILGIHRCCLFPLETHLEDPHRSSRAPSSSFRAAGCVVSPSWMGGGPLPGWAKEVRGCLQAVGVAVRRPRPQEHARATQAAQSKGGSRPGTWRSLPFPSAPLPPPLLRCSLWAQPRPRDSCVWE